MSEILDIKIRQLKIDTIKDYLAALPSNHAENFNKWFPDWESFDDSKLVSCVDLCERSMKSVGLL